MSQGAGRATYTDPTVATTHPGEPVPGSEVVACDRDGHCVTCADEATPARVLAIAPGNTTALVDMAGSTTEVDITLVDDVEAGQWLLIHGGVALGPLARS